MIDSLTLQRFLKATADSLDIPEELRQEATLKYEDIGEWLGAEDSNLRVYSPEIYPQGSFRLGTVVRPIVDADEYDIDFVCRLEVEKEATTQKDLKKMVGDRLRLRSDLARILEPLRRCWRLNYPKQFHMDVLPAIPNIQNPPTGILLTDRELTRWQQSDPKAYAEWFYQRMEVVFEEKALQFAEAIRANVEEIQEWQIKTPLQRSIQLIKRHRDIYFQDDLDNKASSIIVTTLAAKAYRNQRDLFDALSDVLRDMTNFIENRNGRWWVENPVEPDENFADKWNESPEKRKAFLAWIERIRSDFVVASRSLSFSEAVDSLAPRLGPEVRDAARSLQVESKSAATQTAIQVAPLGSISHCQAPLWPLRQQFNASLSGGVYFTKSTRRKLWELTDRSVPKDVWLRFVVKTNAPRPYSVQWQVVNTGREAAEADQLRGDFYRSETNTDNVRWESTRYFGTHWVEAFIIKNGICVARSGRKYVRVR